MQKNQLNYSVIIPHKNTPELLVRLLDSIPVRDDMEIIIVDDSSNPAIVDFDNFPGKDRKETKIIFDKGNKGAGAARNIGLSIASGCWLIFADADDYFTNSLNPLMDKYATVCDVDIVFWNSLAINENGKQSELSLNRYMRNYAARKKNSLDVLRFQFWAPWNRMVKRKVFIENNIKFEEIPTGNDCMAMLKSSMFGGKCAVEQCVVYYYYKPTEGSQTSRAYTFDAYVKRLAQTFKVNALYKSIGYPYFWPILHLYSNKEWNRSEEVNEVKNSNRYSKTEDFLIFIKYIYAKLRGII